MPVATRQPLVSINSLTTVPPVKREFCAVGVSARVQETTFAYCINIGCNEDGGDPPPLLPPFP